MSLQYNVLTAIIAFVAFQTAVGTEVRDITDNIIGNINFLDAEPSKNFIWRHVSTSIKGQGIKINYLKVIQGDMSAVYIYARDKESEEKVHVNVYQPITVY
ncbi:hypothetical protein DdX_22441 [Ditylenchus destructor]|uniref:Salivary secreted peptide n=1 Tax=Ditylenchus destructor TaxID=166010 RepID=A0AAD4MED1_9BILA|nr:hypothetical protein DdX_22441 [Ditylenchus destructor]